MHLEPVSPIDVIDLLPPMRAALLDLLRALSNDEWHLPTVCAGWSVKDVAQHMLADDIGNLSRRRDGYRLSADINNVDELIAFINEWNDVWVRATRRLSPRLLCDLLAFTGPQLHEYYAALDRSVMGGGVG
ncbi:MAG: maleylpyruvate isomerase N-terminal domain-containing protein, partial [Anaerolineae bacterium]|nr:maleylpyruvate isomerase N-terminal domain-containing protein [Anaerolineae bacterium]